MSVAAPTGIRVIEGRYFGDLMDQPRAIEATLGWLTAPDRWRGTHEFLARRDWRRIVLTGMGSSFHALHPLNLALMGAHRWPVMMEAAELVHYGLPLLDEHALVIVVSQSGESAETLRLLESRRAATLLAVTNTQGSPLAQRADHVLLTQAGPEYSVSCKTYVASLVVLQWLAQNFAAAAETTALAKLAPLAGLVSHYLGRWRSHVHELAALVRQKRHLFLAGRGDSLAAAGTGALILKEAARLHAEGMGSATLRHGPMEMLGHDACTLIFSGDAHTSVLNERLLAELRGRNHACELVGAAARLAALRLPEADGLLRPVLEILPVEMLTLAGAALAGREAGVFESATKITATE